MSRVRAFVRVSVVAGLAALGLSAANAVAGTATHVVEPGDTLWELAEDYGCTVDQLRQANELGPKDPIVVGRKLDISACRGKTHGTLGADGTKKYIVAKGDTLAKIAQRHRTSVDRIRELNELDGSLIKVGQELWVPGSKLRSIRQVPGQSRGRPTHGWLHDPARLPQNNHYYRRRTERTYATAHLIDHVLNAITETTDAHPKLHRLAIGDLSDKDGGPLSGHHSHQSGRDIDIGLYYTRKPAGYPKDFVVATKDTLDADATWTLVENLIESHGKAGGVEKLFLDYEVQGWLYAAARRDGWSKGKLRDVFQYPDGKYAKHGIVRHEPKHADHIHARFGCAANDTSCK